MKNLFPALRRARINFVVILAGILSSGQVFSQSLVEFDASVIPTSPAPASMPAINVITHLSSTALTRNGLTPVATTAAFTSSNWPTLPTLAPAGNQYLTFTLTADPGYVLNLSGATLSFDLRRSGGGPLSAYIYSSVAGFASSANALDEVNPIVSSGGTPVNYSFPANGYDNLFSVEIRIYADGGNNSSGTIRMMNPGAGGNIRISGGSVVSCVPVINTISSNSPVCAGSSINLTSSASSVITPITYSWSGPNSFTSSSQNPSVPSASAASAGTYSVTATNVCGSSNSTTAVAVSDITVSTSTTNETCFSSCNGTATANPSGGIGLYSYAWSPSGGNAAVANSLCSGSYTCTVTDGIGCTSTGVASVGFNNCPTITQLTPAWCGATNVNIASTIYAGALPNATNYEFKFTNASLNYSYSRVKGNAIPNMPLNWIAGLQYGNTYDVQVRAFIGGVWRPYGPVCTLTLLPTIPLTQLTNCAATNLTLSSVISIDKLGGALNYEILVTNSQIGYSAVRQTGSPTWSMPLSWFPNLQYGYTYNVQIRTNVGGVWSAYGPVCTITMQSSIPSPVVTSCGGPYPQSQGLTCTSVVGATDYEWQFVGTQTYVKRRGNNLANMYVTSIQGFVNGTYTVSVKAKVSGVWASVYGPSCVVTIGASAREINPEVESSVNNLIAFSAIIYPNPLGQGVSPSVVINNADGQFALIQILDLTGKQIAAYQAQVEGDEFTATLSGFPELAAGMYIMAVSVNDQVQNSKFIVE